MRLGGGGLVGQNSPKENLPPRYSLWRPPLGGDIRDEQIVKLNLLACKCKRLHKRISIDTVITIFCRGSHDMWTGTKLLLQRFSLSSKMRFPLLEVSSLNNWTTLEGVHWGQFSPKGEMLKEMFFSHQSNQLQPDPIHVHNSGRAQRGVGVQDHGDSGREFELQAKLLWNWQAVVNVFSQHRLNIKPPPNGELWGENINGSFNGLVTDKFDIKLNQSVASCWPKIKVGMLQRGDSDIGWADLYIIPDRARFHLKNVILHIVLKLFSQSTQAYRLHRSVWRRIRLFHALQTASPSSVAGPHNTPSASSAPWHHFFSSRNFCVLIFFSRSGWLLCSPLWLSPSPLPFLLNRDGARSPSLDS